MKDARAPLQWDAVDLDATHQAQVRALFAQVFGQEMTPALWQWKYAQGRGLATGARERGSGRLLAHYGGTQRTLQCAGQTLEAVQLGDVMVQAQARGVLSRNGPFAVSTRRFLDLHVGPGRAFDCGFGFPSARHVRLGELLGLYQAADEVMAVEWPLPQAVRRRAAATRWRTVPLDWADADATARRLQALWRRLAQSALAARFVMGQRDAPWWRHRYANHPEVSYRCLWVHARWTRRLLGAVVLRPGDDRAAAWELLDWLCDPRDMGPVLCAALAHCALEGVGMNAWLSTPLLQQVRHAAPWLADGAAQPACVAAVTVQRSTAAQAALHGRSWWLTGGDTDFR